MNSDILTKWTTIFTNSALVLGLVFVGLEFRSTTKATAAERVDNYVQSIVDINLAVIEDKELTDIIYRSHEAPDSLSPTELDRAQHYLMIQYNNFMRIHSAYEEGLIPDHLYETQKWGIGFAFASTVGVRTIEIMQASSLDDSVWGAIDEAAKKAQAYCIDSENGCLARYQAAVNGASKIAP